MAKSGKREFKTPMDTYNSVVGFPDQFKRKNGKVVPIGDKIKVLKNLQKLTLTLIEIASFLMIVTF
jgi:hypothetical protein